MNTLYSRSLTSSVASSIPSLPSLVTVEDDSGPSEDSGYDLESGMEVEAAGHHDSAPTEEPEVNIPNVEPEVNIPIWEPEADIPIVVPRLRLRFGGPGPRVFSAAAAAAAVQEEPIRAVTIPQGGRERPVIQLPAIVEPEEDSEESEEEELPVYRPRRRSD